MGFLHLEVLETSPEASVARRNIRAIIDAALAAADPKRAVHGAVEVQGDRIVVAGTPHPFQRTTRILVTGAGKGSAAMAAGLESILGDRITKGHVTVKDGHGCDLEGITIGEAAHPVPDARGQSEALKALSLAQEADDGDIAFCLISGGGSALWPAPVPGLGLADKQALTRALLACGASIDEMNAVRKHLSRIKGGQLARAVYPARCVSLLISDVPGDRLDVIASGPTCPDRHTFGDAMRVIESHDLADSLPRRVTGYLKEGIDGLHPETPKTTDPVFERVQNVIVANNEMAIRAASALGEKLGYSVRVVAESQSGDTLALGVEICSELRAWRESGGGKPTCLLWGGETTMVLPESPGLGGRNQHLALFIAGQIEGLADVTFASVGTDGTDGPTDAAGGIVDSSSAGRLLSAGFDLGHELATCHSYRALAASGDLLVTGPTLTNVMDIQILLLGSPRR